MENEVLDAQEQEVQIPEDYKAFVAFRESGELPSTEEAPAVGEEAELPSESADEADQTAEESDPADETEQEEEDQEEDENKGKQAKGGKGLARRMRQLTGEIAALKSQLAGQAQPEPDDEEAEEVASSTEPVAEQGEPLVRPMLKDFEDTDEESAWDQYEKAVDAYHEAKLNHALAKKEAETELKFQTQAATEAWNKAASRWPDYNEVVRDEVQISPAMEAVMRMDPEAGTALAYYMGQHPEESLRIAQLTLATNEKQWTTALARAGMELGAIRSKLAAPKPAGTKPASTAQPATKAVTSASRPPTTIRGGAVPPKADVMSDDTAKDYAKWKKAREAQLKRK